MNSAALLLIPPAGLLAWITHASLTLSGSGPRWARWGARWGCLGLVPLACVAMWVWHYYFVPAATDAHIYVFRDVDVYPLVSIFFGLVAWVVFVVLEPLVVWLGTRRETRRNSLSPQAVRETPQGSAEHSGLWWRIPSFVGVLLACTYTAVICAASWFYAGNGHLIVGQDVGWDTPAKPPGQFLWLLGLVASLAISLLTGLWLLTRWGRPLVPILAVTGLTLGLVTAPAFPIPRHPAEQTPSLVAPALSGPQTAPAYSTGPEGNPISKVTASQPCAAANLVVSTLGSSRGMGTVITTVEATSTSDVPCNLEGFAQLTLFQGGKDLHLKIVQQPKSLSPAVPPARRIGMARGDRAAFNVLWKGYGAAADRTTPQTLWFSVNGSEITPIRLDSRPAPFDLIDGAEVTVTRWFYLGPH